MMETFTQYAKSFLIKCDMFENQAEEVVEKMKDDPANDPIKDLWERDI